jgi:NADPH:quinone reductase-like Zn-dependent oxidoreductase
MQRGKTAEQLFGKLKQDGVFACVIGAPPNVKDYPLVKVVTFVSRQDAGTLRRMADAVAAGNLAIPIDREMPLENAAEGHALVGKGGTGKVLLVP